MKTLQAKQQQALDLINQLDRSLRIRKAYGLPSTGKVTSQKVKPSGVSMARIDRHQVRILLDGVLVTTDTLPNFNAKMEQA